MQEKSQVAMGVEEFLENIAFKKLKRLLQETAGLNCDGYRDEYLKRRFEVRLRATGNKTFSSYWRYLKNNPAECTLLLNEVTINYTMFFRDMDVFAFLEKKILPSILLSKVVRIWSAGCATGEEPYSLAILIHKILGHTLQNHEVIIFASDIDKDALSKATAGLYTKKQLQNLEERTIDKYFSKEGELYRIKDFVRRLVRFEQRDLMNPPIHKNVDLILCRNVMIYFSRESQQLIHMHFYNALREGGYLIIGKTEVLSGEPAEKFLCTDVNCRVFQKPIQAHNVLA
ncbi:MAG: protein-glutamate O-methyltransferase CheR [Candidatus Bathyarchaeia archaeon]